MNKAKILWFTGMSGAGKTTIATGVEALLRKRGWKVLVLDGDKIRSAADKRLGFSREDILRNNSSVIGMCQENIHKRDYILVAIISPFVQSRKEARRIFGENFYEIYVKASLETLIRRDTKGFYRKSLNGEMENFIGIDKNVPYEPPQKPEFLINTEIQAPMESIKDITDFFAQEHQHSGTICR